PFLRCISTPDGDAGVHLRFDELHRGEQAKIRELALREQVGAYLDRLGIASDDHAVLYGPQVGVAFPAVQVLAVKELDRFRLALARGDDGGFTLVVGSPKRRRGEQSDD